MKGLFCLIPVLLFCLNSPAQRSNSTNVNVSDNPNASVSTAETNAPYIKKVNGKVVLPPEKTKPITIPKFSSAPVIDGKLDDAAWQQAAVFKDFYQTGPGDNVAPSKPTIAFIGYDERNLYVAFHCFDDPDKIRATVAKRDEVFDEDNVRMWLDTYNDQRRAYIIAFNPFGIQQDGIYTEGQGADFSVDIVMESKGIIVSDGWTVEARIPFKSIRYTAGKGKLWGLDLARNIDRFNDEFDQWMPDDRNVSGFLIKHGRIAGLDEIKSERTLEIAPSVTVSETGRKKRTRLLSSLGDAGPFHPVFNPLGLIDPGRFTNDPIKQDIGVNLKYNITPNVTLDAAYNPDFAEIEADAPVVTANQRFPIFFQEKRPFFLEGADTFQAPLQTFYSRTIIDPDIAAKLTGKIGKNSFGILYASDNAPGNYSDDEREDLRRCELQRAADPSIVCSIEKFVDKNATFGVVRLKHDVGANSNLGFFGTLRTFPGQSNFTGGFDGTFKIDPRTTFVFQAVATKSRRNFYNPETDSSEHRNGDGLGYYASLDFTKKNNGWYFEAQGRSEDYRADAGFTPRVNTNSLFFANRLSTEPNSKAKLIRVDWRQFTRLNYDWKGRSQGGLAGTNFNFQLQGNIFISSEAGVMYERLFEEEFGAHRNPAHPLQGAFFGAPERSAYQPYINANVNKTFNKALSAYAYVGTARNAFDFDFGNGIGTGYETRFPRASPAYLRYLNAYNQYLLLLQTDPNAQQPAYPALDPGKGRSFDFQGGLTYKPIDPLNMSIDYTKSRLTRYDTGLRAFDVDIVTLRSTYQFTRFTYFRTRIDYNSMSSQISGQLLLGWNPHPGTAFYVGYNDDLNYNGFNRFTGQAEPGIARYNRTFFIRASYLFRRSF
jgi:Domain of unknown function (DUF5916)/Carbohydrate family 9 binding domain-like